MKRYGFAVLIVMTLMFSAAAQEQSQKSIAEVARENREAHVRKTVVETVNQLCSKAADPKVQETYPGIQQACKDKPRLIQAAFESALKRQQEDAGENAKLLADKSWLQKADVPAPSGPTQGTVPPPSAGGDVESLEAMLDTLSNKTPRELGEQFARDIQFPGRPAWEQQLGAARDKLVAKTQVVIDLIRSKAPSGALNSALFDMKIAQTQYSDVQAEGISKAAEWDKR